MIIYRFTIFVGSVRKTIIIKYIKCIRTKLHRCARILEFVSIVFMPVRNRNCCQDLNPCQTTWGFSFFMLFKCTFFCAFFFNTWYYYYARGPKIENQISLGIHLFVEFVWWRRRRSGTALFYFDIIVGMFWKCNTCCESGSREK